MELEVGPRMVGAGPGERPDGGKGSNGGVSMAARRPRKTGWNSGSCIGITPSHVERESWPRGPTCQARLGYYRGMGLPETLFAIGRVFADAAIEIVPFFLLAILIGAWIEEYVPESTITRFLTGRRPATMFLASGREP